MRPNKIWRFLGIAVAALFLSACGREAEVRYRISISLGETKSSPSGSAVWSLNLARYLPASDGGYGAVFRAQAIVIDLGGDRRLVALIKDADFGQSTMAMLPEILFSENVLERKQVRYADRQDRLKMLRAIASREGDSVAVDCARSPKLCPMLVVFEDINDPASIKQVTAETAEGLIGMPLSAVHVAVKIVDDDVTTGILDEIPWLATHEGALLPERSNRPNHLRPFASQINVGDFVHGQRA